MIETLLEALPALLVAVGNGCRKRKLPVGLAAGTDPRVCHWPFV